MALIFVGVLALLFASFFLQRNKKTLDELDPEETLTPEQVRALEEATSDWGAAATLALAGIGLLVVGLIL